MKLRSQFDRPLTEEEKAEYEQMGNEMVEFAKAYAAWLSAGKPEGEEPSWKKKTDDDVKRKRPRGPGHDR